MVRDREYPLHQRSLDFPLSAQIVKATSRLDEDFETSPVMEEGHGISCQQL